ncbi:hypothetical protein DL768_003383 [Monosporascus sp. mg162]|nr:hypothetical protein DL768_003383 [Monosporascus sp. mg162]
MPKGITPVTTAYGGVEAYAVKAPGERGTQATEVRLGAASALRRTLTRNTPRGRRDDGSRGSKGILALGFGLERGYGDCGGVSGGVSGGSGGNGSSVGRGALGGQAFGTNGPGTNGSDKYARELCCLRQCPLGRISTFERHANSAVSNVAIHYLARRSVGQKSYSKQGPVEVSPVRVEGMGNFDDRLLYPVRHGPQNGGEKPAQEILFIFWVLGAEGAQGDDATDALCSHDGEDTFFPAFHSVLTIFPDSSGSMRLPYTETCQPSSAARFGYNLADGA